MKQKESDLSSFEPSDVELTVARYSFRETLTKGKNYVDLMAIGASSTANSIMAASNPWATVFLTAAVLSLLYVNESRYLHQNEKSLNQYGVLAANRRNFRTVISHNEDSRQIRP